MKANSNMYLLVFKNVNTAQAEYIQNTFNDFNWGPGFDALEIVENQTINNNLIIQFVSNKKFLNLINDNYEFNDNIDVIIGKGQFYSTLFYTDLGIASLDSFFCYLGNASAVRDENNEYIFKVNYSKVCDLKVSNTKLPELLS